MSRPTTSSVASKPSQLATAIVADRTGYVVAHRAAPPSGSEPPKSPTGRLGRVGQGGAVLPWEGSRVSIWLRWPLATRMATLLKQKEKFVTSFFSRNERDPRLTGPKVRTSYLGSTPHHSPEA